MDCYDCIIVGAGAAGMTVALSLPTAMRVLLLEAGPEPGRKIAATGNGRCNFTNRDIQADFYNGKDPKFVKPVLTSFGVAEVLAFMRSLGLYERLEEGRYYPYSMTARSVQESLVNAVQEKGNVDLVCSAAVTTINQKAADAKTKAPLWRVETADNMNYQAAYLVLAAGGMAAPALGSDGSGLRLGEHLGLALVQPQAALVQLRTKRPPRRAAGNRVRCRASFVNKEGGRTELLAESGEVLLTDYGLSGIPILNLSGSILANLKSNGPVLLSLDLFPEIESDQLEAHFAAFFAERPMRKAQNWALGLLPEGVADCLLSEVLDLTPPVLAAKKKQRNKRRKMIWPDLFSGLRLGDLTKPTIASLADKAKDWRHVVIGSKGFDHAQVTRGGLQTAAFDPETLACKELPGLFAAGEILDVDGQCGGYNLHWAWASGLAVARGIKREYENH